MMGAGLVLVEVCDSNRLNTEATDLLETRFPEVAVLHSDCLSHCTLCRVRAFAFVNGRRVYAKAVDECLESIEQEIRMELKKYGLSSD